MFLLWRRRWDSNPRGAHHAKTISSRSRYDHFDTSPYMSARHFSQPFSDEKGFWKELTERTANLFNFRTVENPHGYKVFGGRNGQLPARFRVRPVMTTSIPLHMRICTESKAVRLSLPNRSNILAKTTGDVNTNLPGNQNCKTAWSGNLIPTKKQDGVHPIFGFAQSEQ